MKQRLYRSLVLLAASTLFVFGVQAGGISNAIVTTTFVVNNTTPTSDTSVFIFKNVATIPGTPACNINQEYAVRINTPAGKAIQQQVQLAIALGKAVYVSGDGTCTAWGDRETVAYVYITW